MPSVASFLQVERILEQRGRGLGLTPLEIRRAYPVKRVRKETVTAALRYFEERGLVRAVADPEAGVRYRWTGPMPDETRPFGVDMRRLNRDLRVAPEERLERLARMHREMPREGSAA